MSKTIDIQTYIDIIARSYGEGPAVELYQYWNAINHSLYEGILQAPLITFEIMPYGACIGLTNKDRGHIKLKHPKKGQRLEITPRVIGVLLHETIHFAALYLDTGDYRRKSYETSHNQPFWISEINRIHKVITGEDLGAEMTKVTSVNGKSARVNKGLIPLIGISAYPYSLKVVNQAAEYLYEQAKLHSITSSLQTL